jgi:hypothetical protein
LLTLYKEKRLTISQSFFMADVVSIRWHQIYPRLLLIAEKLKKLECYHCDVEARIAEIMFEETDRDARPL